MVVLLLVVELSHGTFICLISRMVTLPTLLGDEVARNFLQSLGVLHLLEAHRGLRLWVHSI